jgi:hypothetical protein
MSRLTLGDYAAFNSKIPTNLATAPTSEMAESLDYKGYRVEVGPVGKGWRAAIYAPGSAYPLPESPAALEKSSKEAIVVEAKKIIDTRLNRQIRPL